MKERKSKELQQQDLDELNEEIGVFPIGHKIETQLLRETFELNPSRHFTKHELILLVPMYLWRLDYHLEFLVKAGIIQTVDYITFTLNQ